MGSVLTLLHWLCPGAPNPKRFYDRSQDAVIYQDERIRDQAIRLLNQLDITAGCRYGAAGRNKRKNRVSTLSILWLTFYAMFFSMISTFDKGVLGEHRDLLALFSVFMSSFTVVFSVYEASKRYDVRSENFLRSARLISDLRDALDLDYQAGVVTWEKLADCQHKYTSILDSYSDNHAVIDYDIFRSNIGRLSFCAKIRARVFSFLNTHTVLILSIFSPGLVFMLYRVIVISSRKVLYFPVLNAV